MQLKSAVTADRAFRQTQAFAKIKPINFNRKSKKRGQAPLFAFMVEVTRFELATSTSRT